MSEYVKRGIDVSLRMIGTDLEPNFFVPLGNDGVVQASGKNAAPPQVRPRRSGSPVAARSSSGFVGETASQLT